MLAVVTAATARKPEHGVPDLAGFRARWSALHGRYDPADSVWVRGWLAAVYRLGVPLARRGVQPDVLSLWGGWVALAVAVTAQAGGTWPLLAGLLVVLSGLGDALDGCVATLTDRATRWGFVLDSFVDRVSDGLYLVAVWFVGAPAWLAVATGATIGLHEYVRARALGAGMTGVGAVTVGERPTRLICCAGALLFAGALPEHAAGSATLWLGALGVLAVAGLGHLLVAVRRALR